MRRVRGTVLVLMRVCCLVGTHRRTWASRTSASCSTHSRPSRRSGTPTGAHTPIMLCGAYAVSGTHILADAPTMLCLAYAVSGTDVAAWAGSTPEDKENLRYIIYGTARDPADIPPHMQVQYPPTRPAVRCPVSSHVSVDALATRCPMLWARSTCHVALCGVWYWRSRRWCVVCGTDMEDGAMQCAVPT